MSNMMISDVCIWPAHIEGNEALQSHLLALTDGALVALNIGGTISIWEKMAQGKNANPTPGLKPA